MAELHYFLLVVKVGESQPSVERRAEAGQQVKDVVEQVAHEGEYRFAFSSHDAATFGFLFLSSWHPDEVRARLYTSRSKAEPSPLRNEDSSLILELGEDFSGRGFSRAWTWLQHH